MNLTEVTHELGNILHLLDNGDANMAAIELEHLIGRVIDGQLKKIEITANFFTDDDGKIHYDLEGMEEEFKRKLTELKNKL